MSFMTPQFFVNPQMDGEMLVSASHGNLGLPGACAGPSGGSPLQVAPGYDQVRGILHYVDETSRPWDVHYTRAQINAWLFFDQMGLQPNFSPNEASTAEFIVVI